MSILLGYALALSLLALACWLAGWTLERLWLRQQPLEELRGLARWLLGVGFWIAAAFVLASLGVWQRGTGLVLLGLVVLAAAAVAWRGRGSGPARQPLAVWSRPRLAGTVTVVALVAALVPLFLRATSPLPAWDADVYHLTVPRIYLEHGGFRPIDFNVYSNWPLNTELLYGWALLAGDHVLAQLVHFGFGLLILYTLFLACRPLGQPAAGAWAAVLFLSNGVVLFELRAAYADLTFAFFFLAALLFALAAARGGPAAGSQLLLAGLAAGLLAGVKLTGVVAAACVAVVYLVSARQPWRQKLAAAANRFGIPLLVLWLPWLAKSAWYTGNPMYPLLYGWFGGPDWSPRLAAQLSAWQQSIGMGRTLVDYLLLPLRVILLGGRGYDHFDGNISHAWVIVLPLALVLGGRARRQAPLARGCLGAAGLYFAAWALTSQQARFLIPVLPLLALATVVAGTGILELLQSPRLRQLAQVGAAAGALLTLLALGLRQLPPALTTARSYVEQGLSYQALAVPPHLEFINENLPADARILFLNTNRGFYCHREFLADSFFEASQVEDWLRPVTSVSELEARLADRGITHLAVAGVDWGLRYPPALYQLLRDPHRARLLFGSLGGSVAVLELNAAEPGPGPGQAPSEPEPTAPERPFPS